MYFKHPVNGLTTTRAKLTDEVFRALPQYIRDALVAKATMEADKANRKESRKYASKAPTYVRKTLRSQFIEWGKGPGESIRLTVNHDGLARLAAQKGIVRKVASLKRKGTI